MAFMVQGGDTAIGIYSSQWDGAKKALRTGRFRSLEACSADTTCNSNSFKGVYMRCTISGNGGVRLVNADGNVDKKYSQVRWHLAQDAGKDPR